MYGLVAQTLPKARLCHFLQVEVSCLGLESLERTLLQLGSAALICWRIASSGALVPWLVLISWLPASGMRLGSGVGELGMRED